jgi:exonuclease SbcC
MCYREDVPPLNFESIHLACLSGLNGHGKSALLDAITWALWGEARASHQEDLVHQGREDMLVELDFLAQDQHYRVSRKYSKSGSRWGGLLELQVISGDEVVSITGDTTRETSSKINEILHMDYDTFVNTAFLLQGKADSFTTSTAARRKDVLSEVLDLSYFQRLEDRSKEKSKDLGERINVAAVDIEHIGKDLVKKSDREDRQGILDDLISRLEPDAIELRSTLQGLQIQLESLKNLRVEVKSVLYRISESDEEISVLKDQIIVTKNKIDVYQESIQAESNTRKMFALLGESINILEELDQAAFKSANLEKEKAKISQEIAVHRERLVTEVTQINNHIGSDLKPTLEKLPEIEEALSQIGKDREQVNLLEDTVGKNEEEAQHILARMRHLEDSNEVLKSSMEDTRNKFDMLDNDDPLCPLCRKALGTEGYLNLKKEYEAQGLSAKTQYTNQNIELVEKKTLHIKLINHTKISREELTRLSQDVQSKSLSLERDQIESLKAKDEIESSLSRVSYLEDTLRRYRYAELEHNRLNTLESEITKLGYDTDEHLRIKNQVSSLSKYSDLHNKLLDAVASLPDEQKALIKSDEMLLRRQNNQKDDINRKKMLEEKIDSLPEIESELSSVQTELNSIEQKIQTYRVERQVIREQLQRLKELELELRRMDRYRKKLIEEQSTYDDLTRAFGKNGVQALIIETAIPQLQEDSNELLGRLTENRMSMKLQLQEGRKVKGLPSEELQILISDEIGTRSYETFSGGETFRVNFALRIALSKLLARRSGAPLPILFIDEGFGSQDAVGQERLKEAIQSIQSDFKKIIVITHIQDVKDSFPDRIEVIKTEKGSTILTI